MKARWQGWHLHYLARRAKIFGIEKPLIEALEKSGWYLTKERNVPASLKHTLEEALSRLASIKDFDKTCEEENCPICNDLKEEYSPGLIREKPWELSIELYRWQKEAKKIWWESNGRGIVKVVTGAGKTILAFSIIPDLMKSAAYRDGGLRTVIIVPTSALFDQWLVGLLDKLHIPRENIGVFYGRQKDSLKGRDVLLYVVNSARDHLLQHIGVHFPRDDIFLIADECHRYGSKENPKIFQANFSYTLGLSATPERFGDHGFEEKLVPSLGEIIYSYSYNDALRDGIISPYKLIRLKVRLTDEEYRQYDEYTEQISKASRILFSRYPELDNTEPNEFFKKIGDLYEKTKDEIFQRYTSLVNLRKGIIHTSRSKLEALKWLIVNENLGKERVLIFHERIGVANKIFDYLREKGLKVGIYHTDLPIDERVSSISQYRGGAVNILVSCRALDEGFDVPESNTGIIVAGTSSVRQWIQRMGRILRKTPNKQYSRIYVVFVDLVEKDVFKETELRDFEREAVSVELINLSFRNQI